MKVLSDPRRQEKHWQKKVRCKFCGALLLVTAKDVRMETILVPYRTGCYDEWESRREKRPHVRCPLCKVHTELKGPKIPLARSRS